MKKAFPFIVISIVLALLVFAMPQPAFALQDAPNPPLQVPQLLVDALLGWVTFVLLSGAQKYAPWLTDKVALLASAVVAFLVSTANFYLAGIDPLSTTGIIVQGLFHALLIWLASQGIYVWEKRKAAASTAIATMLKKP